MVKNVGIVWVHKSLARLILAFRRREVHSLLEGIMAGVCGRLRVFQRIFLASSYSQTEVVPAQLPVAQTVSSPSGDNEWQH